MNWLHQETPELTKLFMDRVKQWLTGISEDEALNDETDIINLNECLKANTPFENYWIIKWHHDYEVSHETQLKLLDYVDSGGISFGCSLDRFRLGLV